MKRNVDVVVVGGGPAGSTAAALLALRNYEVVLLERSSEPQLKVGESLMPACYWTFEKLGLLEAMKSSPFPVKGSVQFFSGDGRASTPFYFADHDPHESSHTWQVLRSHFDELLLDHADSCGVEVQRGCSVKEVLFEGDRAVGVRLAADGTSISARVIVDATGQRALLAKQLGLLESDPCLRHAAFFSHFESARLDTGRDAGATLILHTRERRSWFWFIPLPEARVSVGVVGPVDYLVSGRNGDPQRVFEEELAICPALEDRLMPARQLMPMQVTKDFSYRVERSAGDGWIVVGDAGGFIDPIYSTGVFLALKSGEFAAEAIADALAANDVREQRLGAFQVEYRQGVDAMRQLVYSFYDPGFSFADFLRAHPTCRGELVDLLMGNVYRRPVARLLAALADDVASRHRRSIEAVRDDA